MHKSRFLAYSLMMLSLLAMPIELLGQKSLPRGLVSPRQEVELTLDNLKKNLLKEKELTKKVALVDKFKKEFQERRALHRAQEPADELFLNSTELTFDLIPIAEKFEIKKCPAYRKNIIFQTSPKNPEGRTEASTHALEVLKLLCN